MEKIKVRVSQDQHARLPASIIGADLTLRQFRVYAALSWYKGGNATCWPRLATLAKITKMDERHVRRTLSELEEMGLLSRAAREGQSTIYTMFEPVSEVGGTGAFEPDDGGGDELAPRGEGRISPPGGGRISPPIRTVQENSTEEHNAKALQAQAPETYGNGDINALIAEMKKACASREIAYDKTDERNFARHILTAKDFTEFAGSLGITPAVYAIGIIKGASFSEYWASKICGPKSVYRNHAKVYNDIKAQKEKQTLKASPHFQTL